MTGNGVGGGAGFDDVDDGCTTLQSPVFDLGGRGGLILTYWRHFHIQTAFDDELEIVLDIGVVMNAETEEAEWETDPFGSMIELLDIDGDGIQEILAWRSISEPMRIYEADGQREKPQQ